MRERDRYREGEENKTSHRKFKYRRDPNDTRRLAGRAGGRTARGPRARGADRTTDRPNGSDRMHAVPVRRSVRCVRVIRRSVVRLSSLALILRAHVRICILFLSLPRPTDMHRRTHARNNAPAGLASEIDRSSVESTDRPFKHPSVDFVRCPSVPFVRFFRASVARTRTDGGRNEEPRTFAPYVVSSLRSSPLIDAIR